MKLGVSRIGGPGGVPSGVVLCRFFHSVGGIPCEVGGVFSKDDQVLVELLPFEGGPCVVIGNGQ